MVLTDCWFFALVFCNLENIFMPKKALQTAIMNLLSESRSDTISCHRSLNNDHNKMQFKMLLSLSDNLLDGIPSSLQPIQ